MSVEDYADPLGGGMSSEREKHLRDMSRFKNRGIAMSLGGAIRQGRKCVLRAWRHYGWQHWRPGVISDPLLPEITGQLESVDHVVAIDGLVWITLGSEQRVLSAKALRELAEIADAVDSANPETWEVW